MSHRLLALDLGSSFLKGAVVDLGSGAIDHIERSPFPSPVDGLSPGLREFDPVAIADHTRTLLERLVRQAPDARGVVICSQLHGLVLADDSGRPLSRFINWQDQRALRPRAGGKGSWFDWINEQIHPEERRELGNEARPGVPLCFLTWLAGNQALPSESAIAASLPYFVIAHLAGSAPVSDVTNAFGHGALNVRTLDWHRPVIERLGLGAIRWPKILPAGAVAAEIPLHGRRLPVYTPVGDYQCSQVGALLAEGELSINISTGSAVIQLAVPGEQGDFQLRPWFDGCTLKTVTHLPAGRALNLLVRLVTEFSSRSVVSMGEDPWAYILQAAENTAPSDLQVDPAFYFSAMGDRGSITHITEENLSVGGLFRAAFAGMAENYAVCARRLTPAQDWQRLVFSGGVALKTPLLRRLICERLGPEHRLAPTEEDTLLGLLILAQAFTGREPSVRSAIEAARRNLPPG